MEFIHRHFAEISTVIVIIVWAVRVESKNSQNERDISIIHSELKELKRIYEKLDEISQRLSFIEGCLNPLDLN